MRGLSVSQSVSRPFICMAAVAHVHGTPHMSSSSTDGPSALEQSARQVPPQRQGVSVEAKQFGEKLGSDAETDSVNVAFASAPAASDTLTPIWLEKGALLILHVLKYSTCPDPSSLPSLHFMLYVQNQKSMPPPPPLHARAATVKYSQHHHPLLLMHPMHVVSHPLNMPRDANQRIPRQPAPANKCKAKPMLQ